MRISKFLLQLYCHGGIEYEVDAMYEILADGSCQFRVHWKCHVFHVSLLRPYRIKGEGPLPAVLPPGIIEYEVEKILKHADDADNHRRYFVKWTGFEVPTC